MAPGEIKRRLLAVKAHAIGCKALGEMTFLVTSDITVQWHRKLVAKQFDSSNQRNRWSFRTAALFAIFRRVSLCLHARPDGLP